MARKILVVEDEPHMREVLQILLEKEGYEVTLCDGGESALKVIKEDIFDLVLSDLKMPKVGGLEVLKAVKQESPDTAVIIATAFGTTESAVEAMKLGAYDYVCKPFKVDEIRLIVRNALERKTLRKEIALLRSQFRTSFSLDNIVGRSRKMQELFDVLPKVAVSGANVLITGESGTGKELVAKAIHNLSPRSDRAFVAINCGAIPENLLESELFGHMKGAFTGAVTSKEGLFELADGGTLFLDEIGTMPFALQVKLLRVLEDGMFRRVGGVKDISVKVRVISATNSDLREAAKDGVFREDLFYRLNVLPIHLYPLRQRREDIPLLLSHFLERYGPGRRFSAEAVDALLKYPWWGNVRELENTVERIAVLTEGSVIGVESVPDEIRMPERAVIPDELPVGGVDLDSVLEDIERHYLTKALTSCGGVKKDAAQLLRMSFRSFRHRLAKYGIGKDE